MHTVELHGPSNENYAYQLPGSWEEVSGEQLPMVAVELLSDSNDSAIRMRLFQKLTGMPRPLFRRIQTDSSIMHGANGVILPQLDWVFEQPLFHKSHLAELSIGREKWQGPKDDLGNFSVLQLSFADICHGQVASAVDVLGISNLLGALYYPTRTAWNHDDIEPRGQALAKLPIQTKLAAVLNYKGLRATLPKRYPLTFAGQAEENDFGIDGLLEGLAGDKFGPVNEVGSKPLHLALVSCERMRIRQREIESQTPSA